LQLYYVAPILFLSKSLRYSKFIFLKTEYKYYFLNFIYLTILALIFGILFPWQSTGINDRLWTQLSSGRAIIQTFKNLFDLIFICYIFYIFKHKLYNLEIVNKLISLSVVIVIILSFIDYFIFNSKIKTAIIGYDLNTSRYTAFCGEPRFFGRSLTYTLGILITVRSYYNIKSKLSLVAIILAQIGLLFTLSASSIIIEILFISIFLFFYNKKKLLLYTTILIFTTFLFFTILTSNNNIQTDITLKKIELVLNITDGTISNDESGNINEPTLFQKLEVFDRSAANFLYFNNVYFFIGVGPNLISLPASDYIDEDSKKIYGDKIDSVPHTGLINLISSGGLISLLFLILFFINTNKKNIYKSKYNYYIILLPFFIIYFFVADILFIFSLILFISVKYLENKSFQ
jgi:hypothetical protein